MSARALVVATSFAAFGLASHLGAQAPPDFSGQWTATVQGGGRGGPAPDAGSGWGPSFLIVQRADSLIVERTFFAPGDLQPPLKFRYALDGSESRNTLLMGRGLQEQRSTVLWEGETLVIVTRHVDAGADGGAGVTSEVRHRLSFQPSFREAHPPSLVVETTRGSVMGGSSSTTRAVHTRG